MAWRIYNADGSQKANYVGVDINSLSGTLPISKGGTGQTSASSAFSALSPTAVKGDIIADNGTDPVALAVGTDGQFLKADSTAPAGVSWDNATTVPDAAVFGDGSDGNVTISGAVNLTRDMFYNNLTISAGAVLDPKGWKIFVAGTLDISSAPAGWLANRSGANGLSGTGGAAGGGTDTNTVGVGTAGGNGGTFSAVGTNSSACDIGGKGGNGGNNADQAGFATGGARSGQRKLLLTLDMLKPNSTVASIGGSGGGGGSGSAVASGPGAGGGGGGIFISARTINRSSSTNPINAIGGNGVNGGGATPNGSGGGGGGGGGVVYLIYKFLTGSQKTDFINVSGGNGGNGGNGGGGGQGGNGAGGGDSGLILVLNMLTGTLSSVGIVAGNAGSAHVGLTGGAGGSGGVAKFTL